MNSEPAVSQDDIDRLYLKLKKEAEATGYYLDSDVDFTKSLVKALLFNEDRYGYWACPCRLADGVKRADLDIVCPCDYRDADVSQYGTCY